MLLLEMDVGLFWFAFWSFGFKINTKPKNKFFEIILTFKMYNMNISLYEMARNNAYETHSTM